jgi:hypothetical protein
MLLSKPVVRPIMEVIVSRRIGGTERHGQLRVVIRCKREKNGFVKIVYVVMVICFLLLQTSYARNRGACVTQQDVTLWRTARRYCVTRVMSGEIGNLVVKVNVKKNVEEGPMMASAKLLEAWVSSSTADSVLDKANGVIRVASGLV